MNGLLKRLEKLEQAGEDATVIYSVEQLDQAGDLLLIDNRRGNGAVVGKVEARDIAKHHRQKIIIERGYGM